MRCKLCNSSLIENYKKIDTYILLRCKNCNFIFLDNLRLKDKIDKINLKMYESEDSKSFYISKRNELQIRAQNCTKILRLFKKEGKLLDIGCSYGFYCEVFNKYGYETTGMDISKDAINYISKTLKLNVIRGNFEKYKFNNKHFDIITMFDVIEHFNNPNKIIKKIRLLLNKKGIVIIQTPNIDSLIYKVTGTNWFWLLPPQHLSFFSFISLMNLLKKNKFNILYKSTWDDIEEFTNNILYILKLKNKGITKTLYFLLKHFIYVIVLLLKGFWNRNYRGGEILIYAQKTN